MSPIKPAQTQTLQRLYERKREQLEHARSSATLMQRLVLEAELQALASQLAAPDRQPASAS